MAHASQVICTPLVALGVLAASSSWAASFIPLGHLPGGDDTQAYGISGDGSVVAGAGKTSTGNEGFRWTLATGIILIGDLPGDPTGSQALDVSRDGVFLSGWGRTLLNTRPMRWSQATGLEDLGTIPGGSADGAARGINSDGSVAAGSSNYLLSPCSAACRRAEAFRWEQGVGIQALGDLPGGDFNSIAQGISTDGTIVVGQATVGPLFPENFGYEAFRWTGATGMVGLGSLVPDGWSRAVEISGDDRVIVGEVGPPTSGDSEAFRWTQSGGMVGLGDLPGGIARATATAASFDGSVIVGHGSTALGTEAFIWDDSNGMRNLREVLENDFGLDLTGWRLQVATDVSDNGLKIVGYGINPMGKREAWVANPVKVPIIGGAGLLLLVGLLLATGTLVMKRSRRLGSTG